MDGKTWMWRDLRVETQRPIANSSGAKHKHGCIAPTILSAAKLHCKATHMPIAQDDPDHHRRTDEGVDSVQMEEMAFPREVHE